MDLGSYACAPLDDDSLHALIARLLPSAHDTRVHRHGGTVALRFHAMDDVIAASIAASSANLCATLNNTFEDKHARPRNISSCSIQLAFLPELGDERLRWFLAELALLRRSDGVLSDAEFAIIQATLHSGIDTRTETAP